MLKKRWEDDLRLLSKKKLLSTLCFTVNQCPMAYVTAEFADQESFQKLVEDMRSELVV